MKPFLILIILLASLISFAQTPVIFWASDPVKPNETILAQGDLLDEGTELQIAKLANKKVKGNP